MYLCQDCEKPVVLVHNELWVHADSGAPIHCPHGSDPRACCGRADHWVHSPLPETRELERHLREGDHRTWQGRARRLRFVQKVYGPERDRLRFGGPDSVRLFEEMRLAYVNGLYLSTVVVAGAYVESNVAATLYVLGGSPNVPWSYSAKTVNEFSFAQLLHTARKHGLVDDSTYQKYDLLRQLRNSYVHPTQGNPWSNSSARAYTGESVLPILGLSKGSERTLLHEELLDAEARWAIQTVLHSERPRPFRPSGIPWQDRLKAARYL